MTGVGMKEESSFVMPLCGYIDLFSHVSIFDVHCLRESKFTRM